MENMRGAALMTLAMLGFAIEDMLIKLMSGTLPTWQIILILGVGGASVFAGLLRWRGERFLTPALLSTPVLLRNLGEMIGTLGFVTALALIPISTASAILQATPLVVTLGAALFLKEPVGWRRWSAVFIGFCGVLLIIRPGLEGFDILSLFALQGVLGLAIRDLATRRVPRSTSSSQLSFLAFLTLIPAAAVLSLFSPTEWVSLPASLWPLILCTVLMAVLSYYLIVGAMRVGDVGFVTPFRYSRIVFALIVGLLVFQETIDALTLIGAFVVVASGIYTLWRERKQRQSA